MKDRKDTKSGIKRGMKGEEDKINRMLVEWCCSKSWESWEMAFAVYDTAEEGFSATDLKR